MSNEPEPQRKGGVSLAELNRILEKRRQENPEAARLKDRLVRMAVELSWHKALQYDGWLSQSQAAELLNVHRGTINRAIKAGKVVTNGLTGAACRVNPESLLEYYVAEENSKIVRGDQRGD